jgi:release factor glutamine methyltransferase
VKVRPAEVVHRAADFLARHDVQSPQATAETLMMLVLGTDRAGVYARAEALDAREARLFGRAICQRCAGTPLQHLTGEQSFRRITLEVRAGVFVPRPETEILVEAALERLGAGDDPVVVDVGTGTGAVALSIKDELPGARVFATDVSPEAIELARANADRLGLDVTVLSGELLDPLPSELRGWVDLVVSNPPYVTPEEFEDLPPEVRADPATALLGGIEAYESLARDAARWLRDGGVLAVEIGERQAAGVVRLLGGAFTEVEVRPDLAGRDRVVVARRP